MSRTSCWSCFNAHRAPAASLAEDKIEGGGKHLKVLFCVHTKKWNFVGEKRRKMEPNKRP